MKRNRCCFIICWFGELPNYFKIWAKTCEYNKSFDFLIFTDNRDCEEYSKNIRFINITFEQFKCRIESVLGRKVSLLRPYRVCDFRPMYGLIFENELKNYDFWGYCDVDVVFGQLEKFITDEMLEQYDAIFNGGHLSLLRNSPTINELFKKEGAIFDYRKVSSHDAIFAFDEITGIQRIARTNLVKAKYLIPYIETEIKYKQLRSRLEKSNPKWQAFYWNKGGLYRLKIENECIYRQEIAYMHLQKRKLVIDDSYGNIDNAFWITPTGFCRLNYETDISEQNIKRVNPYEGNFRLKIQDIAYKVRKVKEILKRNPYQIYVRLKQEKNGINGVQGTLEGIEWEKF